MGLQNRAFMSNVEVNIEELKGGVIPAGFKKIALPYESAAFHEPLQGDRQVKCVLPDNCSIAEAKSKLKKSDFKD